MLRASGLIRPKADGKGPCTVRLAGKTATVPVTVLGVHTQVLFMSTCTMSNAGLVAARLQHRRLATVQQVENGFKLFAPRLRPDRSTCDALTDDQASKWHINLACARTSSMMLFEAHRGYPRGRALCQTGRSRTLRNSCAHWITERQRQART